MNVYIVRYYSWDKDDLIMRVFRTEEAAEKYINSPRSKKFREEMDYEYTIEEWEVEDA